MTELNTKNKLSL